MIEVRGLSAHAGQIALVRDVSFTIAPGQVLALLGESGSGKTTTGLALLGEAQPGVQLTGTVRGAGRIGYLQQNPAAALNPARRVAGVLTEIARAAGRDPSSAAGAALQAAHLPHPLRQLRRYPHQFSGGQQQRLVLAQALVGNPGALVLDEPTSGLDPITRRAVLDELAGLARHGLAVVIATHDLAAARQLADTVVVLHEGAVCETGPASTVLHTPSHPHTRALLAAYAPSARPRRIGAHTPAMLEVEHLDAGYQRPVLHDISFAVPAGARLAVIGASGSGKTTLGRCLAGLHEPARGRVRLRGEIMPGHLQRRSLAQRRAIQYIFQDPRAAFDPARSVADQVARTAIRLRGASTTQARDKAGSVLKRLGIDAESAVRVPAELSGGELQRAALARALLAEPEVLVCDEVTSALDSLTRARLVELLTDLPATLVLITHDLALAAGIADVVAVVEDGRLAGYGPPDIVLTDILEKTS